MDDTTVVGGLAPTGGDYEFHARKAALAQLQQEVARQLRFKTMKCTAYDL